MKLALSRPTLWLLLGMLGSAPLACGSSDEPAGPPSGAGDAGDIPIEDIDLAVYPQRQYTGFDGVHDFQVPFSVFRARDDLTVTASDPSMVEIVPASYEQAKEDGHYFLIKAKKAGEVTLTARSRGKEVSSTLIIQPYTESAYERGEARYTTPGEGAAQACASCHQKADGADHSPSAISAAADSAVKAVIRNGIDLSSTPIRDVDHRWDADGDTLDGLVVYLRALPPRGYSAGASFRSASWSWGRSGLMRHARIRDLHEATAEASLAAFAGRHPRALGDLVPARDLQVHKRNARMVRWQQKERGVPVLGAELTAHFSRDGALRTIDSTLVSGVSALDLTPTLGPRDAERIAVAEFERRYGAARVRLGWVAWGEAGHDPTLGIDTRQHPRLVYEIGVAAEVRGRPVRLRSRVDAHTGELVEAYDDVKTVAAQGRGVFGEQRTFEATEGSSDYELRDEIRGIVTYTANEDQDLPGDLITSASLDSWDRDVPNGAGSAVDAHYFAGVVHDYFDENFGRNGIDGKGGTLTSSVHYGLRYDNAFWDGRQMAYGDGDVFGPFAGAPDIVAHELTHALTQSESSLEYRFQSGAINEAISDVFGAIIENSIDPDDDANWRIGEKVQSSSRPLRSLMNPGQGEVPQPNHMREYLDWTLDQDNGGVHLNSGIINNAAYLMTVGGTHPLSKIRVERGIGWQKLAQLFYLVSTDYLQRQSEFLDLATATQDAADELDFSAAEKASIDCAWQAVGVLPGNCGQTPTAPGTSSGQVGSEPGPSYDEAGRGSGADDADFNNQASACQLGSGAAGGAPWSVLAMAMLLLRRRARS